MNKIRTLFSPSRPIDRPIEKVIDYAADDDDRLLAELSEYEITENLERCFEKFIEAYDDGVKQGVVTEIGVWVSGFYGSGKSSFTKYLGLALEARRTIDGRPLVDLLAERFDSKSISQNLRRIAAQSPAAVIMLDLGSEQLTGSSMESVTNVLWWKVLQWAGYSSNNQKVAQLEFDLEAKGLLDEFKSRYRNAERREWDSDHHSPIEAITGASRILPDVWPEAFPHSDDFLRLRLEHSPNVSTRAKDMVDLVRKRSGHQNVIFVIDEAGQYVASRSELILNLDGLARSLKEIGMGRVWILATGQQTLTETQAQFAFNSSDLFKLKDRFPVEIDLPGQDIREITQRRLLKKSQEGSQQVRALWATSGGQLATHAKLEGSRLYQGATTEDEFALLYPFLPQHFEILFAMIRNLARQTGGIGLRSSIRVVQDVLVDVSHVLEPGEVALADLDVGALARIDHFYDTLRADIARALPEVEAGVEQVRRIFGGAGMEIRVAKAIAALQTIDGFPRTEANIAALIYEEMGGPSRTNEVKTALAQLMADSECGVIDDPQAGGYTFLSGGIRNLREERDTHIPLTSEIARLRTETIRSVLTPTPSAQVGGTKKIEAGINYKTMRVTDAKEITFQLEPCAAAEWDRRLEELLTESRLPASSKRISWVYREPDHLDDTLVELARSNFIVQSKGSQQSDQATAQYLRSEGRRAEQLTEAAAKELVPALLGGVFVHEGMKTVVATQGTGCTQAASKQLADAGARLYSKLALAPVRVSTELASNFLKAGTLDRITSSIDPLGLVVKKAGKPQIDTSLPVLSETLREFEKLYQEGGSVRVPGKRLLDYFDAEPYGWTKDTTRYLFAALLACGELEVQAFGETFRTPGPDVAEVFKSTVSFQTCGVSPRDSKISLEALDRAARVLADLFGDDVFPAEDRIAEVARNRLSELIEEIRALPTRLDSLGLPGSGRAEALLATCTAMLRGGASDAPGVLGDASGTVASDIRWARESSKALDGGAEAEVRDATALVSGVDRLITTFGLDRAELPIAQTEELTQFVASGSALLHRADVRGSASTVLRQLDSVYRDRKAEYERRAIAAKQELEQMPEWSFIAADDRQELATRVAARGFDEAPADVLGALEQLLAADSALDGALAKARHDLPGRVPPPPKTAEIAHLRTSEVARPAVIADAAQLRDWLDELRGRLQSLLLEYKQIEIGEDS